MTSTPHQFDPNTVHHGLLATATANRMLIAKTLIYGLLVLTTSYFFVEDFQASAHTFRGGVTMGNLTAAFATATDSFSWLILLAVFELETHTLEDRTLKRGWRWLLLGITLFAYSFIVQAFFGYVNTLEMTLSFAPLTDPGFCAKAESGVLSIATALDDYTLLSMADCLALNANDMLINEAVGIIAPPDVAQNMRYLAWADVINAGTWLLVVVVLEADVILQLGGGLSARLYRLLLRLNLFFYAILFAALFSWVILWQPVDALDALLWLLAFFLIELNILKWRAEPETGQIA